MIRIALMSAAIALSAGQALAQQADPPPPATRTVDPVVEIERLQGLVRAAQEAALQARESARQMQTERDQARTELAASAGSMAACDYKNRQLHAVAIEILDRYKRARIFGKKEPFTGLKRVQLENIYQGYEDRLYENRFRPDSDKSPPSPPAATEPSQPKPNR